MLRCRDVKVVNNWGQLGTWTLHVCRNPQLLGNEMEHLVGAAALVTLQLLA